MGHITGLSSVEVTSIGAGGGSIAWIDAGGLLRVGPAERRRRARARPATAAAASADGDRCRRGARLLRPRLLPRRPHDARRRRPRARPSARRRPSRSGCRTSAAARAILAIANEAMIAAIREITINQGVDPRECTLVAGGGAGGLNDRRARARARLRDGAGPEGGRDAERLRRPVRRRRGRGQREPLPDHGGLRLRRGATTVLDEHRRAARRVRRDGCPATGRPRRALATRRGALPVPGVGARGAARARPDRRRRADSSGSPSASTTRTSGPSRCASPARSSSCSTGRAASTAPLDARALGCRAAATRDGDAAAPAARDCYFEETGVVGDAVLRARGARAGAADRGPGDPRGADHDGRRPAGLHARRSPRWAASLESTSRRSPSPMRRSGRRPSSTRSCSPSWPTASTAIVREMTNTLLRTGRSRDPQHRPRLLLLDRHRRRRAAGRGRGPADPRRRQPVPDRGDGELHPDLRARATRSCTTTPTTATPTTPTTRSWCRCSAAASTCSPRWPRPTRPTAATGSRRPTAAYAQGHLRGGRAQLPLRARPARLRATSRTSSACAGGASACRTSGTATTWRRSAPRGSASGGWRSSCDQVRRGGGPRLLDAWFDYSERRMAQRAARAAGGAAASARGRHDPLPGVPDGIPLRVEIDDRPRAGDGRRRPARQHRLRARRLQRVARVRDQQRDHRGVQPARPRPVPHNEGSFRRIRVHLRENCVAGIPLHPTCCSVATTNVADRLINITQSAFAELGDGYGLAEGAVGSGPGFGVISGADARRGDASYINQVYFALQRRPRRPERGRLAVLRHPGLRRADVPRQHRGRRAEVPDLIDEVRLLADSEGAGRFRGAPGSRVRFGPTDRPMTVAYVIDGHHDPPRGVLGGGDAQPHDVVRRDRRRRRARAAEGRRASSSCPARASSR